MSLKSRSEFRKRRHNRLRQKVRGTAERPRMCVNISLRHMSVQFIDDAASVTLAAASTQQEALRGKGKNNVSTAKELGKLAAQAAKEKGIGAVVFDRGGNAYKGRVKALAEAAREEGLRF